MSQTVVATPQPTPGGRAFGEYAEVKFTAKIGTFHFKTVDQLLRAVIHWSDGTHSTGKVEGSYASGDWYVEGTHTYAKTGVCKVNVSVYAYLPGSPNLGTSPFTHFTSVVTVTDLKPSGGGVSLLETATQSFTAKLGEFKYKTIDQILNAVIDWGDGTHSDGKLIGSYATGEWYVQGTHTYALVGKYKVDVKVFGHPAGTTYDHIAVGPVHQRGHRDGPRLNRGAGAGTPPRGGLPVGSCVAEWVLRKVGPC